jgi:hypothetical protein
MWKGTGLPQTWPGKIKHKRMYRCYGDWQHTQLLTHLFFFFDAFLGTVWVLFGHLFGALFATRSSCLHLVSLGPTWFPFVLLPTWSHFFLRVYTWYTWFHLVSLGPTSSYFPLGPTSFFVSTPGTLGSIWFHLVPLGSTWFHLVPLGSTSSHQLPSSHCRPTQKTNQRPRQRETQRVAGDVGKQTCRRGSQFQQCGRGAAERNAVGDR